MCKNRTTYKKTVHRELAVGYDFSGLSLLGLVLDNKYIPHYELPNSSTIVPHPVSRNVKSSTEVFQIMRELNDVVMGKVEMPDFMMKVNIEFLVYLCAFSAMTFMILISYYL